MSYELLQLINYYSYLFHKNVFTGLIIIQLHVIINFEIFIFVEKYIDNNC